MNKKLLLVDFNGVLSHDFFWQPLKSEGNEYYGKWQDIQEYAFAKNPEMINGWMKGKYTTEDVHQKIEEDLGIKKENLIKHFIKGCEEVDISERILDLLKTLKEKYFLVLFTDNMDSFDRFTLPKNSKLKAVFDFIDNSYAQGQTKFENNAHRVFDILDRFETKFENAFLLDDSEKNCSKFSRLGGISLNAKGEEKVMQKLMLL